MKRNIVKETQREAIVNRPHNLAGSVKGITKTRFCVTADTVEYRDSKTTPALLKLFMESIDNPIDVAIETGRDIKIDIKVTKDFIQISDNGPGIPSAKKDGVYQAFSAFCEYNTSSNYKEAKGQGQKGVNGIGIKLCTTLSKKFFGESDDGKKKIKVTATENNLNHKVEVLESTESGVKIKFYPDFDIFDVDEITQEHQDRMYEYTLMQALTYPDITFRFNNKIIKMTAKKLMSHFDGAVIDEQPDYFIGIAPNPEDEFKQISYINGLETYNGGTHVDYIIDTVAQNMRQKLVKKFKTIKPGDIKAKLLLVVVAKNMKNVDWDGQTKSSITSPKLQMKEYFKTDFDKFTQRIMKNQDIMLPITELFLLKEKAKLNAQLKKQEKKKPKSEKFMPPIGSWKNIFLAEGDSASNSIRKILGRQGNGFYAMFGVPPNGYDMSMKEVLSSDKMQDLQNIIGLKYGETIQDDINFEDIIITTDFDLPGHFISGQLMGLLYRFGRNLFDQARVKRLITPLILVTKNDKIITWFYNFEDYMEYEKANKSKRYHYDYKKGLGSWDPEELEEVIQKDGLETMLETFTISPDSGETFDSWLNGKRADKRKEMLEGYEFNIMGV